MDKDIQIWNQYEDLRKEIIKADSLNYQIIGIVVAGVAAIITASFSRNDFLERYIILLCVYLITFPGNLLLIGNRIRIWRIATYMRVFLEPELDYIKWESRLHKQAEIHQKDFIISSYVIDNEFLIITVLNCFTGFLSLFAVYQLTYSFNIKIVLTLIIISTNLLISIYTKKKKQALKRYGEIEKNFYRSWEEIRELGNR